MVQNDHGQALWYLCKATRLIGIASFPLFFGISAIAPQIVEIFLGSRWASAVVPLRLLAISMTLNPVAAVLSAFLAGVGHFRASFHIAVVATILFPLAYAVGSRWGVEGVCAGAAIAYSLQFFSLIRRCAITMKTAVGTLLRPLCRPFLGAVLMYCCVLFAQSFLPAGPIALLTALLIILGATIYGCFCIIFCRPTVREFVDLVRRKA
jgi:O-antigen/teichoic acid export membrane protein